MINARLLTRSVCEASQCIHTKLPQPHEASERAWSVAVASTMHAAPSTSPLQSAKSRTHGVGLGAPARCACAVVWVDEDDEGEPAAAAPPVQVGLFRESVEEQAGLRLIPFACAIALVGAAARRVEPLRPTAEKRPVRHLEYEEPLT